MSDWVAIKDEHPEPMRRVLFSSVSGVVVLGWRRVNCNNDDEYISEDSLIQSGMKVSHWMPLPKVPEVQE